MRTRETTIKRHQAFIDGFPMSLDELIRKLQTAKKLADTKQVVGFQEGAFGVIFGPTTLIVQWDEAVPDEKPDSDDPEPAS